MRIDIDATKAVKAMDRIKARIDGLSAAAKELENFVMRDAGVALDEVKERFPVGSRGEPGDREGPHMVDDWHVETSVEGRDTIISVTHPLSGVEEKPHILKILNDGSKEHIIKAKNWPLLVFYHKDSGKWIKVNMVLHPGTRPYLFVTIPAQKARDRIRDFIKSVMSSTGKAK